MYQYPSVQQFKDYFFRDFPFGPDVATQITDQDIAKAFQQANVNFVSDLWASQGSFDIGYFYLVAHYLSIDMQTASQGINSSFSFFESSKSVGGVSQSFSIPQAILDNPTFAMFARTGYGSKYLSLVLPQLAGAVYAVAGSTRP